VRQTVLGGACRLDVEAVKDELVYLALASLALYIPTDTLGHLLDRLKFLLVRVRHVSRC
jgi:hypothetical protein